MSLTESGLLNVVRRQYYFKMKSYIGYFITLAAIQIISLLFTIGGMGSMQTSSQGASFVVKFYSGDMITGLSIFWVGLLALIITSTNYLNTDFMFVSNRLSSNLANIAFLVTASVIGGVTAILCGFLQKALIYVVVGSQAIIAQSPPSGLNEAIVGMIAAFFYTLLFSAIGYFLGKVTRIIKPLIILLPTLFFGLLMVEDRRSIIIGPINFFTQESSLALFIMKITITTIFLYILSIVISNRKEVRQ